MSNTCPYIEKIKALVSTDDKRYLKEITDGKQESLKHLSDGVRELINSDLWVRYLLYYDRSGGSALNTAISEVARKILAICENGSDG